MSNSKPIPGLASRQAALRLLDAVCRRGETLDQAMAPATRRLDNPSDKSLAHNIAANVLRWMGALDAMIDSATRLPLAEDAKARMALRIALVQVLVLDTPQHAAISTALPLVQGGPRRLVHGVFSALMRKVKSGELALPPHPPIPSETAKRWTHHWGEGMVAAAAKAWSSQPPLDLSFRDAGFGKLEGESLAPKQLRSRPTVPIGELPGFEEGRFWAQDLAASTPVRLLGDGGGKTILDLCAAPGGKTMQLASNGWNVTAIDSSKKRMMRLYENLERTQLKAETRVADLMQWEPEQPADAILLDAPCSATGIFRRHPDVLHCIGPRQIADRAETQSTMLRRAAAWVKPGGIMVYAVCSLEPEEGEEQVAAFLDHHVHFETLPVGGDELPSSVQPTPDGNVRTLPNMLEEKGHMDGFFIARLRRKD